MFLEGQLSRVSISRILLQHLSQDLMSEKQCSGDLKLKEVVKGLDTIEEHRYEQSIQEGGRTRQ